jgi:hypothetical protein
MILTNYAEESESDLGGAQDTGMPVDCCRVLFGLGGGACSSASDSYAPFKLTPLLWLCSQSFQLTLILACPCTLAISLPH